MVLHTPSGARRRSERPLTIARAPPPSVGCEGSDRLIAELLVEGLAGEDEQAVAPGGHKHHWSRHDGILSATNCDDGSKLLLTNRQVYFHRLGRRGEGHIAICGPISIGPTDSSGSGARAPPLAVRAH